MDLILKILKTIVKGKIISFILYGGFRNFLSWPKNVKHVFGKFDDWSADILSLNSELPCY